MKSAITLSSTSHNVDLEAQAQSSNRDKPLRASNLDTAGSRRPTLRSNSSDHAEGRSCAIPVDESSDQDVREIPRNTPRTNVPSPHRYVPPLAGTPTQSWKPWKPDEPLRTKIPESKTTMEDWVKAMEASDDGMCKGWRDQIDTLIIFAGLFSATVTAFTIESYQWLEETPADTLARLQLRNLLNATRDPAIDRLAPATFHISSASVAINTLWFASLTLSLAAVVTSILCKQWLHEYQRYDNFTTNEAFLIHGLRHRGLQAWRVPEIIAFLPIILQTALVLFLVGILVLLWPLQIVVVSIATIIVGLTFLFLAITTVLPSIQYIFPQFDTQCAYKSSQSWSFLFISAYWMIDFGEFTSWALFDRWEVTRVYSDAGHTLFRVHKLLSNSVDAVLSIYSFLIDKSLNPTVNADLALLSDFVDGLDTLGFTNYDYEGSKALQRIEQLKGCLGFLRGRFTRRRLKPGIGRYRRLPSDGTSLIKKSDRAYYSRIHSSLSMFLRSENHISHTALFNRYVEHWARSIDVVEMDSIVQVPSTIYLANTQYDPEIAMYLVGLHSHLLKTNRFEENDISFLLREAYPKLMDSYHQHEFNPPPAALLKDIQEMVNCMPESNLYGKVRYAERILDSLAFGDFHKRFAESHASDLEKQYFISFAGFFVTLFEREDTFQEPFMYRFNRQALMFFREYLDQNPNISS